jgi:DNA-binding transcriptional ArsR family regulator
MSKKADPAMAEVFFALGDGTRLSVLARLGDGALSATALSGGATVTRQAVLKHLQVLEGAGLVKHKKHGREVLYSVEAKRIEEARAFLEAMSARWDRAIDRLREMVEEPPPKSTKHVRQ